MTENKRELIKTIAVIPSNFEYIAKTGIINGTLLVEIERVMEAYAAQQKSEIKLPTDNEIEAESFERYNDKVTGYIQIQKYHAFIKWAEWLRNQITER